MMNFTKYSIPHIIEHQPQLKGAYEREIMRADSQCH